MITHVSASIERGHDGTTFRAVFSVVNDGRLMNVMSYIKDVADVRMCMYHCVQHRQCVTINYHDEYMHCELVGEEFAEGEKNIYALGWLNFGTADTGTV